MKILVFNWNSVLTDVISELIERGHTVLPQDGKESTFKKADVIVLWNENANGGWAEVINRAHRQGKKVILIQHGRRGVSRIYPPFNEKLLSDKVCVWSTNDKKRIMDVGVSEDKIVITGCPLWSYVRPRVAHEGINVVFAPDHWDTEVSENLIIADELRKLKGVNIITKTIQGVQEDRMYDNPISSNRHGDDHMDIVSTVLSKADIIVSISDATFELLAESLDIPVVSVDFWIPKACAGDEKYKEYKRTYSNACTVTDIKNMNKTIMSELKNPSRLSKERSQICIDDGGINISDPVINIVNVIENI